MRGKERGKKISPLFENAGALLSFLSSCMDDYTFQFVTALFFILFSLAHLPGLTLYGDAESQVDFSFPEDWNNDRYDSPVNPGNVLEWNDMMYSLDLTMKMEEFTDTGNFNFWISLEGVPSETGLDEASYSLDVMRLGYDWALTDSLRLNIGRQGFLTGYGYGWNPMDLFNPLKDPSDPDQDMTGIDAVSLSLDPGGILQTQAVLLVTNEEGDRVAYEDLRAGLTATLLMPFGEWKMALLGGPEYALGGGLLVDILGIGLYGEGSVREKGRMPLPGGAPDYSLNQGDDPVYSALAGLEYVFSSELSLTFEYFYNGEGLDQSDRENYKDALESYTASEGAAPSEYYELYRPGNFGRHYLLLNLFYPLYSLWSEMHCTVMASPDTATLIVQPEWLILPSGNFELALGWNGMYSLDDGQYGEAWLAPVNHVAYLNVVYHF